MGRRQVPWSRVSNVLGMGGYWTVTEIMQESKLNQTSVYRLLERNETAVIVRMRHGGRGPVSREYALLRTIVESVAKNPFAVAAGFVAPFETVRGRVFKQDMTIHLDEMEGA